ncbi:NAD-dependent epimerase/dehydratase family protein [uncultured Sphingomonas sp.]|uniref:NAD-dependent epimerase/dehydratase family protein n=1 Tax=uncultured Sphingomonas sp. TaxID=158754 RepID=UPI0035CC7AA2
MTLAGLRCAVLGAGGFIGTNLCLGLQQSGAHVTGIGRRPHDGPAALSDLRWVEAEFADAQAVAAAVEGQDLVFHLLGGSIPVQSNDDPVGDVEASLIPSLRLIEACQAAGIGRFVFVSSGGTVYGPAASIALSESAATNPITAYGINKLAVEKYLGLFRHLHAFDAVVLRLANPYGPHQHRRRPQGVIGTALARALAGEPIEIWGDGSVVRDYVYIDDVVAALVAAGTYRGRHWVFNIGSGQGRSVRQVVADICVLTSTPPSRVIYHPSRPADVPYNVLDCALAQRELKWRPDTSWIDGLKRTADWLGG